MANLFQGSPLPSVTTTDTTTTQGPEWYQNYLQTLAQPGANLVSQTGDQLVAPQHALQTSAVAAAPGALSAYAPTMQAAGNTAERAAQGITPGMIYQFLNPYTGGVVDEMARQSQQNMQRNLLPTLRGAFAGTGAFGSQRMAGALGQMGADVQANLTGQQAGVLKSAYDKAIEAAGTQSGLLRQAADTQRGVATSGLDAAVKALEEQYGLGSKQQQFEQSKILAPIAAARSAADVLANLKVPTTVANTRTGPLPGAYSSSPLAQIAGLGSLFASGSGGTSPAQGALRTIQDILRGLSLGGSPAPAPAPAPPSGGGGGDYNPGDYEVGDFDIGDYDSGAYYG